jgi:hypothetical protein
LVDRSVCGLFGHRPTPARGLAHDTSDPATAVACCAVRRVSSSSSALTVGRPVKTGYVVVCWSDWSDESLGSMTVVSSRAPWVISMRCGLALAATGRVTVSTPF